MITQRLSIRPARAQHAAAAWLLAGSDPAVWLEQLTACGVSLEACRLYPLPTSPCDRTASAALVVPRVDRDATGTAATRRAAAPDTEMGLAALASASPRVLPYAVFAGRFYLPADADFSPPIDAEELASFCSSDVAAYVFHPTIGLVAVDERSVLHVRDLLQMPAARAGAWNAARPGVRINERLVSIELADPPSLAAIFDTARDDIGSQASSISKLAPAAGEPPSGPIGKLGRGLSSGLAKGILWMTNFAPPKAANPTWIDSLRAWAGAKLAKVDQAIDSIRNREIRRLLDLLENNPDEGLRYALPLEGPAHRGTAPPTNYLARRSVDFSLSSLGGGRAGDYWQIERQYHERLRQSYRDLAAREVSLGRHRRAAYIYAELLHDLSAAAATLKAGGHHREAAVLYRDRLDRPLEAAKCLEEGGLFGEAISMFETLREYERAGDLHRRLDQSEQAQQAYQLAVDAHTTAGDRLSAAKILEQKMELPDQALEALQAGWPDSPQAQSCLQSEFELLARLGRHQAARERVAALRDEQQSARQTRFAATTLAATATAYPSDEVRAVAADTCRVIVGRNLANQQLSQDRQLLQSIEQLAGADRLLRRDCGRFGRRPAAPSPRRMARRAGACGQPALVAEFCLPSGVAWQTVVGANELFYAAGYQGNALAVVRGDWSGCVQMPSGTPWPVHPRVRDVRSRILLAPPTSRMGAAVWSHCPTLLQTEPRQFPPTDQFLWSTTLVAVPGERERIAAVARMPSGVSWVFSLERDGPCLIAFNPEGLLIRSVPLARSFLEDWDWLDDVELHATDEAVYVACGVRLLRVGRSGEQFTETFHEPIRCLAGTMPHTRMRLAIGFQHGGYVLWPGLGEVLWPGFGEEVDAHAFGQELDDFEMCFTRGGALVAVSPAGGEIYNTQRRRVELIAVLDPPGERPLAVVPTSRLREFAVCLPSGIIRVYRLD